MKTLNAHRSMNSRGDENNEQERKLRRPCHNRIRELRNELAEVPASFVLASRETASEGATRTNNCEQ